MILQVAAIIFLVLWLLWGAHIYRTDHKDLVLGIMLGFLMSLGTMILLLMLFLLICAAIGVFS